MPERYVAPAGRLRATRVMLGLAVDADRRRAILAFLLFGLGALTQSLFAWWLKLLIDGIPGQHAGHAVLTGRLLFAALGMAASIAGTTALTYAGYRVQQVLRERAHHLVERRLVELVGGMPTLEIHETPDHLAHLEVIEDQSWVLGHVIPSLTELFATAVRAVVTVLLLFSVSPLLLLLPVFGLPALLLSSKTGNLFDLGNQRAAESARLANHLYDLATTAGPAKEVRLFRLSNELKTRYRATYRQIRSIHRRVNVQGQAFALAGRIAFLAGYLGAIVLVIVKAIHAQVPIGDAALTAVLAGQMFSLMTASALEIQIGVRSLSVAGRYVYLQDLATDARLTLRSSGTVPNRLTEGIRLDNVSYRYPGADGDALHELSVQLPAGATVAVVGDNGAGKTTLVKLLAGLYRPSQGTIAVDGRDLAAFEPDEWRKRMSAGFQDHAHFELLAWEAVGIGDLPALEEMGRIHEALDRAGAGDLVDALPSGLDTQLGPSWDGGVDLSGGQWQKLALGRAMMRTRPLLLLLDEPTAALDADTEHHLFERWTTAAARLREATGAITLLVSHRFSTVRMADLIVVLDHGGLVERGTHDELIARGGLYAELFELQARSYR